MTDKYGGYDANLYIVDLQQGVITDTILHAATAGRISSTPLLPTWSHDGETVAIYVYNHGEPNQQDGIKLISRKATTTLVPNIQPGYSTFEWSSDDQMLLYKVWDAPMYREQKQPYVALNINDAKSARALTVNALAWWIPDTHDVLTVHETDSEELIQLERINAETGESRVIGPTLPASVSQNLILVDRETLLVINTTAGLTVDRMNLETDAVQRLVEVAANEFSYGSTVLLAPDHQLLAVRAYSQPQSSAIHFYDLQTGTEVQRTPNPDPAGFADWIWQPDSRAVIFSTNDYNGNQHTYRADIGASGPATLVSDRIGGTMLGWMKNFDQ